MNESNYQISHCHIELFVHETFETFAADNAVCVKISLEAFKSPPDRSSLRRASLRFYNTVTYTNVLL